MLGKAHQGNQAAFDWGSASGPYLIARLDDTGQLDGLLELLGEDADVLLVVSSVVVICTRARQSLGCKTECDHERRNNEGL